MNPGSVAATCIWMGIANLGAWDCAIHPAYHGVPFERAINSVGSETLVIAAQFLDRLERSAAALHTVKSVVVLGAQPDEVPHLPFPKIVTAADILGSATHVSGSPAPWDTACVLFTSGTTGPSKPVIVPWAQMEATTLGAYPVDDFTADECFYCYTPSSHVGYKIFPYMAAMLGARVFLRPGFRRSEFWDDVQRVGVTTAGFVGSMAEFLLQEDAPVETTLRNVGLAPSGPFADEFRERFGVRTCTKYSTTELSHPIVSSWDPQDWRSAGRVRAGYPGYQVRLVDENDQEVPIGIAGELVVRTDAPWTLTPGYFGMPEATLRAWRNGWFHTGDVFTRDGDGNFFFIDRAKDAIRRRGENVSSYELEEVALRHPDVAQAAAIAVPASDSEDEIKLCVVSRSGAQIDLQELAEFLGNLLPAFMVPRYLEVLRELPLIPGVLRVEKAALRRDWWTPDTWDRLA